MAEELTGLAKEMMDHLIKLYSDQMGEEYTYELIGTRRNEKEGETA